MRYLHVRWKNPGDADDAVEFFYEVGDDNWEVRKIEVYADGSIGYASAGEASPTSGIADAPIPRNAEVASDPQFELLVISKDEFERAWAERRTRAQE